MKAAMLHGPLDMRYEEVPVPEPAEEDVLVEILANGICGSDIHFYEEGKLGPFVVSEPYIPGHEAVGRVIRPNPKGARRAEGQLVVIEPGIPCRRCEQCKSGRYNLCPNVVFMSAPPVNGTFAEYAAVAADFAHPVPQAMDLEAAALVEPISVAVQACNRAGLTAGDSVAIVGSGPIGLITLLVAQAYGATEAVAVDVQEHRLAKARFLGAETTIHAKEQDVAPRLKEVTSNRGVDVVFDTSGSAAGNALTPLLAKRGGVVTLVGWPETRSVEFPMEEVIEKELDIRGVNRYCNTYSTAISLLTSGKLDVGPLVTHRFAFKDVCEAFHFASTNRHETVKVVVRN